MFVLRKLFAFIAPHNCLLCGRESDLLCSFCVSTLPAPLPDGPKLEGIDHLWVGASYEDVVRDLMHQYKFERAIDIAKVLIGIVDRSAPALPAGTAVTYIPTATSRVRARGYDQSRELARCFARNRGLPLYHLLLRQGQSRQVGASRRARTQQLQQAYRLKRPELVKGARILVIDDIVTTGATLQAAAKVLRLAGAESVTALAVAWKQ